MAEASTEATPGAGAARAPRGISLAGEPRLQLLIEAVTGRKVRLLDPRDLERPADSAEALAPAAPVAPQRAPEAPRRLGWGFEAKLVLTRDRVDARTVHIEGDDKKFKDPLVLDLGAVSSELSEGTFDLDLDADGRALQTLTAAAGGRARGCPGRQRLRPARRARRRSTSPSRARCGSIWPPIRRRAQATTSSERPSGFASPLRDIAS